MDPLDDVFAAMRVIESAYARWEASAPWGVRFAAGTTARFGLVASGACWLTTQEPPRSIPLAPGDSYVIPNGATYTLGDHPRSPATDCFALTPGAKDGVVRIGGGGAAATVITGWFVYDELSARALVALLPRLLHIRADGHRTDILKAALDLLAMETQRPGPGSGAVVSGIADMVFVQAIRGHLEQEAPDDQCNWLSALSDKRLGAALRALHDDPAKPWTVDALASVAGMSRSAFSARFKERIGEAPLEYLTRWRMFRAGVLLRRTDRPLADIARQVGYESDAALSKAFHRVVGVAPSAFRRDGADSGP